MEIVTETRSSKHSGEESGCVLGDLDKLKSPRCSITEDCDDPLFVKNFKKRNAKRSTSNQQPMKKKVKVNCEVGNDLDVQECTSSEAVAEIKARRYQLEVLEKAISGNIIVYLETGCGKTLIAVLLIKSLANRLRVPGNKRIAIFLAPTVHLVHQQSEVISINTDLKVGYYFGDMGVDSWTPRVWATEVDKHEVLVMTPQVLLDALGSSSLHLDLVEVLILDECHHAQKRHPFAQIMSTHYHNLPLNKRPKVLGMTASPVIRKGVTSSTDCNNQIQKLEAILDSKVCIVEDRSEVECLVPTPNQQSRYYRRCEGLGESVRQSLENLKNKFVNIEAKCDTALELENLCDETEVNRRKLISKFHNAVDYCLSELGLWPALQAADIYLRDDKDAEICNGHEGVTTPRHLKIQFLRQCLEILQKEIPPGSINHCRNDNEIQLAVKAGFISPKIYVLVKELRKYREVEDVHCIIFVERVVTSLVLANLTNWFSELSFFRCDHIAGVNAEHCMKGSTKQQETIKSFRSGKLNLLVATSVAEEGLDVQSCNSVMRFDLPKTVRSYIQSRGRARRPGSDYIFFLERGNALHESIMLEVIKSEASMRQQSCSRANICFEDNHTRMANLEIFKVESTGAVISMDTSVKLIYRYCSKLPGDRFYRPTPEFIFTEVVKEKLCVCTIRFPPNAPLRFVVGEGRPNRQLSKQAACFEACKQLYSCGALTANLVPAVDLEEDEDDNMNMGKRNRSGAGTTKRKELHVSVKTDAFSGGWGTNSTGVTLQAYKISFCFQPGQQDEYADFAMLLNTILDEDVSSMDVQLHLNNGRMSVAKVSALGNIHLDEYQLKDSMKYHEVLYNGMFNRLVLRSKGAKESSYRCLLTSKEEHDSLWTASRMYLLLPLLPSVDCGGKLVDQVIDWKAVSSTAIAATTISRLCASSNTGSFVSPEELLDSVSEEVEEKDMIQTAAGVMPMSSAKDKVVLTVHTGRIYCIVEVLHDMNAMHAFPMQEGSEDQHFLSYSDYFLRTYKKALRFPRQPLFRAKQSHRIHNLLNLQEKLKDKESESVIAASQHLVELPPELCIDLGLRGSVVRSLYLLPSVIHRWTTMMNASQLRHEVFKLFPDCPSVSSCQIMQALCTLRCMESFSFEGLELLGDSLLKYAVSRQLFLLYSEKHEGHLSARRSRVICNANLHRLALMCELPKFIRDEVFDPSRWVAPGMYCKKDLMCKCNTNNILGIGEDGNEDGKVITDRVVKIGKTCSNGHRWLCSKTISDAVEALIGAYFVEGGYSAAVTFMKFAGIDVDFEPHLIDDARKRPVVSTDTLQIVSSSLKALEKQLGYTFQNKALLLEAITHASEQQSHDGLCYQRLEFLGDSVLDFLITRHLFDAHPGLSPGCLTDLRSAAVNNHSFARVAVKHNLQKFLRHGSSVLLAKITHFVKSLVTTKDDWRNSLFGWDGIEGPKVLGDIVESLAGAILVDSGFNLDVVWAVMKPLLAPIVKPETLPFHPVRELLELCQSKGLLLEWRKVQRGLKTPIMEVSLELGEKKLVETSLIVRRKEARKEVAKKMLASLQGLGLTHPRKNASVKYGSDQEIQYVRPPNNTDTVSANIPLDHIGSVIEGTSFKELCPETGYKQICAHGNDEIREPIQIVDQSKECKLHDISCCANLGVSPPVEIDLEARHDCTMTLNTDEKVDFPDIDDKEVESFDCAQGSTLAARSTVRVEDFERDDAVLTSTSGSNDSMCSKDGEYAGSGSNHTATLQSLEDFQCLPFGNFNCLPPALFALNTERLSLTKDSSSSNEKGLNGLCATGDFSRLPSFLLELKRVVTEGAGLYSCTTQSSSMGLEGTSSCIEDVLRPSFTKIAPAQNGITDLSSRIKAGNGRSSLYELCSKRKWREPQFSLSREEGLPHDKRFTFSVSVDAQKIGIQVVEGTTMSEKKKAMDSAAVNMILHLKSMGI